MRISIVVSLIFSCFVSVVSAQSVNDLISQASDAKSSRSCLVPPEVVGDLVQLLSEGVTKQESNKILSFLASQPSWMSDDQSSALRILNRLSNQLSKQNDILTIGLVARALEKADGELLDILSTGGSFADTSKALDSLIKYNEGRNPVYASFAKLALAELLQERAFQQISFSSLPLLDLDETSSIRDLLIEAIGIYSEVSEDYSMLRTTEGFGSRNNELDLPYLISLLKFIAGDESWTSTLQEMLAIESKSDAYDTRTSGRHILVERFLKPPLATPLDSGDCVTEETALTKTQNLYNRELVSRFFNPVQLVNFTCNVLDRGFGFESLNTLVSELQKFENRDYRVVLGHYQGEKIRFSFLTTNELQILAKQLSADIKLSLPKIDPSQFNSQCSEGLVDPIRRSASFVGVQETGLESGYIYIGTGLALVEAEQLKKLITMGKSFRDAYIIRPVID